MSDHFIDTEKAKLLYCNKNILPIGGESDAALLRDGQDRAGAFQDSARRLRYTTSYSLNIDKDLAAGLRGMTAQVLRAAYNSFEAERMSEELEALIREIYTVIVRG